MKKTIENINEMKLKVGSSKMQIKLIKLQPDLSSKKKERNQTNKIKNEKGEVTTDTKEIQGIIIDYDNNRLPINGQCRGNKVFRLLVKQYMLLSKIYLLKYINI